MAKRPAYYISDGKIREQLYSFEWFSGFALSQKQKSIDSLHQAIIAGNPDAVPLEISTKSKNPLGVKMSAFNLKLQGYYLENVFQSSKVFTNGGAYRDLLQVHPKDAKKDQRLRNSGTLQHFDLNGEIFPLEPKTLFYDYIYIMAVKESLSQDEIHQITQYTHFTDIEFNPEKSINTQARSVAIIRLLLEMYGEIPELRREDFLKFHQAFVISKK